MRGDTACNEESSESEDEELSNKRYVKLMIKIIKNFNDFYKSET